MFKDFVVLEVDNIAIIGQIFLPGNRTKYPVVCLCHGIPSGNPPDPNDGGYPALAETICEEGFATFFFNFRGTGNSSGNMDIPGWTHDLQAVVDYLWLLDSVDKSYLPLVGFSAGAATSVYVASKDIRVSGVAACACPADFSFFTEGDEPQATIDCIDKIAPRPLLLVHGSQDERVPVGHAHRLYDKAREPKKLVIIDGAGHKLRREAKAVEAILDWLKTHRQNTES